MQTMKTPRRSFVLSGMGRSDNDGVHAAASSRYLLIHDSVIVLIIMLVFRLLQSEQTFASISSLQIGVTNNQYDFGRLMALLMIQIFRFHSESLPVLPDMFQLLVSAQWFAHIKCILAGFSTCGIVVVVIDYSPENTVSVGRKVLSSHSRAAGQTRGSSYPRPRYNPTAVSFPSLTKRSTNHAFCSSHPRSRALVRL